MSEALKVYAMPEKWKKLVKNCMNSQLSWENSAEKYIELYKEMLNK